MPRNRAQFGDRRRERSWRFLKWEDFIIGMIVAWPEITILLHRRVEEPVQPTTQTTPPSMPLTTMGSTPTIETPPLLANSHATDSPLACSSPCDGVFANDRYPGGHREIHAPETRGGHRQQIRGCKNTFTGSRLPRPRASKHRRWPRLRSRQPDALVSLEWPIHQVIDYTRHWSALLLDQRQELWDGLLKIELNTIDDDAEEFAYLDPVKKP
jgi:hypothetical protein